MSRLGVIGCGNMGGALVSGAIRRKFLRSREVWVYDRVRSRARRLARRFGVREAGSLRELVMNASAVLLAVKPHELGRVSEALAGLPLRATLWISILAGTPRSALKRKLGATARVVRVMPNLGATVGESFSALSGGRPGDRAFVKKLFDSVGETVILPERFLDSLTALSGSGPAYFFQLMEWMSQEALRCGLPWRVATRLAKQTAIGAAALAACSAEDPGVWRKRVSSVGGTTRAALRAMARHHMRAAFRAGIQAALKRAKELSKASRAL